MQRIICFLIIMVAALGVVVVLRCISDGCISTDSTIGNFNDTIKESKEGGGPICPSNIFYLPSDDVPEMEFRALCDGNMEMAVRLARYYGIYRNKPRISDMWAYRAAQLGSGMMANELCRRNLLNDQRLHIFSDGLLFDSTNTIMSNLAKEYVLFNYLDCRTMKMNSSERKIVYEKRDWALSPAMVKAGSVAVMYGRWEIDFLAYKARNRSVDHYEVRLQEVLVFPSMPSTDSGVSNRGTSGNVCQRAISMAETNGLPWIVVAVDLMNPLMPKALGITDEEKFNCVGIALRKIFSDFSLPLSTVVIPAGNIKFVNQMKVSMGDEYRVSSAPEILLVYGADDDCGSEENIKADGVISSRDDSNR
jgi:hypothetical protein